MMFLADLLLRQAFLSNLLNDIRQTAAPKLLTNPFIVVKELYISPLPSASLFGLITRLAPLPTLRFTFFMIIAPGALGLLREGLGGQGGRPCQEGLLLLFQDALGKWLEGRLVDVLVYGVL